jgi:NuA3 HAT complex component NTO1
MAPLRTAQARTRPRRSLPKAQVNGFHDSDFDTMPSTPQDEEPPLKRARTSRSATATRSRWIPGGRGGGGRHVDVDADEAVSPAPKVTPAPRPRGRPRKDANKNLPPRTPRTSARSANRATGQRPRYSTAAAAATAATAHGDGYKPREERGWEEFHPELDLDADFAIIPSAEIDGTVKKVIEEVEEGNTPAAGEPSQPQAPGSTTPRRRGRPPGRRTDSVLQSLLMPETPKIVPPPGPNPRERLTLPKPSFRELDPFTLYEEANGVNYVDKTMANVGYQESEVFLRPDRALIRQTEGSAEEDLELSPDLLVNVENSAIGSGGVGRVEYDMDEQDVKWLEALNKIRVADGAGPIKPAIFEVTMTKVEKEWHALEKRIPKPNPKAPQTQRPRSSSAAAVNGEPAGEEGDTKCAICDNGDCENANAIVFCDGCDLAVHQECYGVPYIPEGQWLCRKCQLVGNSRPSCIFCPHEGGAFKQTNNAKWAHLFCAIWIPEVQIGNPSLMEPITDVEKVPPSRWKLLCYICNQGMGAGIQCSDGRCYRAFHLTCARQGGLYLRMKTGGGQNTLMDQSALRAYCHQHSPNDWKADHNTDRAHETTVKYCKEHFKGQVWADSRASALAINETPSHGNEKGPLKVTLTNKKGQKQKTIWRLPSGAPVIPEVILKSIEDSLVRFSVQRKKEYVSELCKYWTLKREARRGAALLKRLQLQMDTFSSFEVTRRDYKAQGATGRARLDRRIDFSETLMEDLKRIVGIAELTKQREAEKLAVSHLLKNVVDIVYFPIPPLLDRIIEKAMK